MKKHLFKRKNGNYYYRIIHGDIREEKSARTKDREVAEKKLNARYREIEREAEGLAIPAKIKQANQLPLDSHLDQYLAQNEREWSNDYYERTGQRLRKLFRECGWRVVGDVARSDFLNWRAAQRLAPKTLNDYLAMIKEFIKWMVQCGLADVNELETIPNMRRKGPSFERRSLTMKEFPQLMSLEDDMRRAVYTTAIFTGLRRNELAQLEWGDIHFDENETFIVARASTTKNSKKAYLPMVEQVRDALLKIRPTEARGNDLVFNVPTMKVYKSDLKKVGIDYLDDQGNRLDFHALRTSMCSLLHAMGAPVRVIQELMRHSDIKLTTQNYTDANLLPKQETMNELSKQLDESVTHFSTPKPTLGGFSGDGESQGVEGVDTTKAPVNGACSRCLTGCDPDKKVAERGGFEPPVPFIRVRRFSKPLL